MTEFWQMSHTFYAWLVCVELPGMGVEYEWLIFFLVNALETLSYQWIGEQSEITAAAYWEILAKNFHRRDWKFNKAFWVNEWMS